MRISILFYFVISSIICESRSVRNDYLWFWLRVFFVALWITYSRSNAAALFDDMNWDNILRAFGLDDNDPRDYFLPMMTYTGWKISLYEFLNKFRLSWLQS